MRKKDVLALSTRMFVNRPSRTLLTVLGMSIGIGAVLFLVSLGYGLQRAVLGQITTADSLLSLNVSSGDSDILEITNEVIKKIEDFEEVTEISPLTNLSGQISLNKLTSDCKLNITQPNYFRLSGILPITGASFTEIDAYEVLISQAGTELFNYKPEEIIGKEIFLTVFVPEEKEDGETENKEIIVKKPYKIIGVTDDTTSNSLFIPVGTLPDIEFKTYEELKVKIKSEQYIEVTREKIITMGFLVSALSDTIEQAKKIFKAIQITLAVFGLIALTVSAIGMFNTMTISLLERTHEIGIMRAIGITERDIRDMFLLEAIIMGFLGGLGGIMIGYGLGEIINIGINMLAKNFGGQSFDLFYQPIWFLIFIMSFSTIIGFLTGVYPARVASKINPLEALKNSL